MTAEPPAAPPNGATAPQDPLARAKDVAEAVTRGAVAVISACYVAGLLIVNLSLAQYGVGVLGFLQTEYVLAGALWFAFVGWVCGCAFFFGNALVVTFRELVGRRPRVQIRPILTNLRDMGAAILSFAIFYFWLLQEASDNNIALISITSFEAIYFSLISGVLLVGAASVWQFGAQHLATVVTSRTWLSWTTFLATSAMICGVLCAYLPLTLYAERIYPNLSPKIGGGRPPLVRLFLSAKASELGLPSSPGGDPSVSGDMKLVFRTTEGFVLVPPSEKGAFPHAVWIASSLVRSIEYVNPPGPQVFRRTPPPATNTPTSSTSPDPTPTPPPTAPTTVQLPQN